jgi:hypothetical protein
LTLDNCNETAVRKYQPTRRQTDALNQTPADYFLVFRLLMTPKLAIYLFFCISIYIHQYISVQGLTAQRPYGSMTGSFCRSLNTSWRRTSRLNSFFLLDEAVRLAREKVRGDTRSAMLVQARRWVPQGFAVGSTHDGAARMEMFTWLTKRIARHLPGYRHTQCRIQFYPTIKVSLLSGNFLLFLSFYFHCICYCDLSSCRTGGGGVL